MGGKPVPHNDGVADCGNASNTAYTRDLCRCDACKAAHSKAERDRYRRKLYGKQLFVDAGPVRERLLKLYELGYTVRELNRMGISRSNQYALTTKHNRTGKPLTRCNREFANKVMAVAGRKLGDNQLVPADAAVALVRSWVRHGLSYMQISEVSGVDTQVIYALNNRRRKKVYSRTLRSLVEHHDELDKMAGITDADMMVIARDRYGNETKPMTAYSCSVFIGTDLGAVVAAARSGHALGHYTVRPAKELRSA